MDLWKAVRELKSARELLAKELINKRLPYAILNKSVTLLKYLTKYC